MRVSFKYMGQSVYMDDVGYVVCTDELTREILEESQAIETFKLAGDVTHSPVFNVVQSLGSDVIDLQIIPTEIVN